MKLFVPMSTREKPASVSRIKPELWLKTIRCHNHWGRSDRRLQAEYSHQDGDKERAFAQILSMNGKLCHFFTAIAVAKNNGASGVHTELMCDTTKVQLRQLNDQEIQTYVELDNPIFCAGSFKAESLGIALFESIETSDPSALIGLPSWRHHTSQNLQRSPAIGRAHTNI